MSLTMTRTRHFLILAFVANAAARLMELPGGADLLVDHLETSFHCPDAFGYYADEDHYCRVFHVCNPMSTGMQHFSFVCGNQTVFDQLSLACVHPDDAIPCEYSRYFAYVNERIGSDYNLHYDTDIERAAPYISTKAGSVHYDRSPPAQFHQQELQDVAAPQVQQNVGQGFRSHQRQTISRTVGPEFTVVHPRDDFPSAQEQQRQQEQQERQRQREQQLREQQLRDEYEQQQQQDQGERRALRNSIRRRARL